LTATKI